MGNWVEDAMAATAPGETFCGLQVPELRRGEQAAQLVDAAFMRAAFASNGALAVAQEELRLIRQAKAGWGKELGSARAERSRLKNLILTKSPEASEKDTSALRSSLAAITRFCEEAEAGLRQATEEEAAMAAEVDRLVTA